MLAEGHRADAPGLDGIGDPGGGRVPSRAAAARARSPRRSPSSTRQYAKRQQTWFRHQLGGDGADARRDAGRPSGWRREIAEAWDVRRGGRMKIGITCYPTYGGSGAVATELGLELARRGHEVHFITYDSPVPPPRIRRADLLPSGRDPDGPLSAVRPLPLHARAGVQAARGGAAGRARPPARPLRHPARHHRVPRPRDARAASGRSRSSPRCTAPTSRWWARSRASTRSPSSRSSRPTR